MWGFSSLYAQDDCGCGLALDTSVKRDDYMPYYIQVRNAIEDHIHAGGWQVGDQLPGEPELGLMFSVSRTVIRQALKELEVQGMIRREKGKGTFVSAPKIDLGMVQTTAGFFQDAIEHGLTPTTVVLAQHVAPATATVAAALGLEPGAEVVEIHRLRGANDEFVILDRTYLPLELCSGVLEADLSVRSLYEYLATELGLVVERAHRTLEAVLATEYVADKLAIDVGDPLLVHESVAYLEDGTPIEYFKGYHASSRTRFAIDVIRRGIVGELAEQDATEEVLVRPIEEAEQNDRSS